MLINVKSEFEKMTQIIISKFEGGYSFNPNDRGGETIFGISSKFFKDDFDSIISIFHKYGYKEKSNIKKMSEEFCKSMLVVTNSSKILYNFKMFMEILYKILHIYYSNFYYKLDYYIESKIYKYEKENIKYIYAILFFVYDTIINCGEGIAIKMLQESINTIFNENLKVDGILGNNTANTFIDKFYLNNIYGEEAIINNYKGVFLLLNQLYYRRIKYYNDIVNKNKSQSEFLNGWINRVNKLMDYIYVNYLYKNN